MKALQEIMIHDCETVVADAIRLNRWTSSPEVQRLEDEVQRQYKTVLAGKGQLIDFRQAVEKWKMAGTR